MGEKDELKIFPPEFYVGQTIKVDDFSKLAHNTSRMQRELRFFVRGDITVLYSFNKKNLNIKWDNYKIQELQIIQLPIETRLIESGSIMKLARAVQRGITHQIIIILSNDQCYKVVVPEWHIGSTSNIFVVDTAYYSLWMKIDGLVKFFSKFNSSLTNPEGKSITDLWNTVYLKINGKQPPLGIDYLAYFNELEVIDEDDDRGCIEFLVETLGQEEVNSLISECYDESFFVNGEMKYYDQDYTNNDENTKDPYKVFCDTVMDETWGKVHNNIFSRETLETLELWLQSKSIEELRELYMAYKD